MLSNINFYDLKNFFKPQYGSSAVKGFSHVSQAEKNFIHRLAHQRKKKHKNIKMAKLLAKLNQTRTMDDINIIISNLAINNIVDLMKQKLTRVLSIYR